MRKASFLFFIAAAASLAQRVPGLFIVELAESPAKPAAREWLATRQSLARTVEGMGARVAGSTETVMNALVVEEPSDDPALLRRLPGIVKVYPVFEVQLELDRAPRLHAAPEAWRLAGGMDNAGKGIKIAVIDTGIDKDHPGFQDPSLTPPAGYPKGDPRVTNNKVIVARNYAGAGTDASDRIGHGTAVAMAAAGAEHRAPYGQISGIAPKAFLGNYRVFSGAGRGTATTASVIQAIDDAVEDGMDIINLSLGSLPAPRVSEDAFVLAVERASRRGVVVVTSAGNGGPDANTASSPASAPSVIAVGAKWNDRILGAAATVGAAPPIAAIPAAAPAPPGPIEGGIADVEAVDHNGLACGALPEGSLQGRIALILRGQCTFEEKLNNARRAGAAAGLVYTDAERDVAIMGVGSATLPAMMITYAAGLGVKAQVGENPGVRAVLRFEGVAFPVDPNRLGGFSSRGPGEDARIVPDVAATGVEVYTAAQNSEPAGDLFDASRYMVVDGTSFSAPMVAGAVAVLKARRGGLTVPQYKSLLVNSSTPLPAAGAQQAGAGVLHVERALRTEATAEPATVSFGAFGPDPDVWRQFRLTNLGAAAESYTVTVEPAGSGPAVLAIPATLALRPGTAETVLFKLAGSALPADEYQGQIVVRGGRGGELRVPYWYGVPNFIPRRVTVLNAPASRAAGEIAAILFRITDVSGTPVMTYQPEVSAAAGEGTVESVRLLDEVFSGVYQARVRLGSSAGNNVFAIRVGEVSIEVTIRGT